MKKSEYTKKDVMACIGEFINPVFFKWLVVNGFFTAPASTKYHGAYEGGLCDHSVEVAISLVKLTNDNGLVWEQARSPYIIGMFHDLCKIDSYKKVTDLGAIWFTYNDNTLLPGHGEKSVQLLAQHIQLTEEELLCIRWHMGAFDAKENWQYYDRAIRKYPNVLWTHTADMIASKIVGV